MTFSKLKILFIGTVEFSYDALQILIDKDFQICGVITKKTSTFNSDFKDLTPLCKENAIPFYFDANTSIKTKEEFIEECNPDVIYCFGWSYLLPNNILHSTKHGVIGFHPTLLPNNRGRHPIIWALFLGLKETGLSFFIMDESADTGDIISQQRIEIKPYDDATSLYRKIKTEGLKQIISFTNELEVNGRFSSKVVQKKNEGNNWRKRTKLDGLIDFRMHSETIYNLVRALTHPYIGAHIDCDSGEVKVWKVEISNKLFDSNYEPGKILDIVDENIVVKTYNGAIILTDHEFKKLPNIGEYL